MVTGDPQAGRDDLIRAMMVIESTPAEVSLSPRMQDGWRAPRDTYSPFAAAWRARQRL